MYLQDNYAYGKILDKKKYLEAKDVEFTFPEPSRPLKDSQAKLTKLKLSGAALRNNDHSNTNLASAREAEGQGNGSQFDESGLKNLSVIFGSNPKISEFSDKHLGQLSERIDTLASEYGEIDKPLDKGVDIDALLMQLSNKDQVFSPIRIIHANSNIGLDCYKNQRQYFKVKCDGYKFPMKVRFGKKNLHFKIFISFTHRRPDELKNEFQSKKHTFEVPLSAMWSSSAQPPPAAGELKISSLYMCVLPEGDFKDTMAITFEARETKIAGDIQQASNRDGIDYKGLLKFSDQYHKNVHTLSYYQKMEAKQERLRALNTSQDSGLDDDNTSQNASAMNKSIVSNTSLIDPEMLINFKKKREMRIAEMARIDDERRDLAKIKSKLLQQQREQEIIDRKSAREGSILQKRQLIEGMLELFVTKTQIRSWAAHFYLIRVLRTCGDKVKLIREQRDLSMKKFHASLVLVRAFKRFLKSRGEKFITITEETKSEVKFHKINTNDGKACLMTIHNLAKILKWTKAIPLSMEHLGLFYKSAARGWIIADKFLDFRRRVVNFQKSARNFRYLKKVYIQHCVPILTEALEDIKRIGEQRKIPQLKLKNGLQHSPEEIMHYLFEYHMYCYLKEKYSQSERDYKEFKTLGAKIDDPKFVAFREAATLEYTNSGLNSQKYSKIINSKRQKEMKDEISLVDPTIVTLKSKQREEQLKKLKVILKLVFEKLDSTKRFTFEFNEVSARLFLIGYFQLDKVSELHAVHEICSNSTVFEHESDHAGHSHTEAQEGSLLHS